MLQAWYGVHIFKATLVINETEYYQIMAIICFPMTYQL